MKTLANKTLTFWELSRIANGHGTVNITCGELIKKLTDLECTVSNRRSLASKIDQLIDIIVVGKPRRKTRKGNLVHLKQKQQAVNNVDQRCSKC